MSAEPINCGSGGGDGSNLDLRIAAIFVILITSSSGALFPILAKRSSGLQVVPKCIFECVCIIVFIQVLSNTTFSFAKYFGSGVIVGKLASFYRG